jgi:hypothetical protein
LPHYPPQWLRFDLVAGVTLAAFAVPVSLAYAVLAGLPPQMGLYCCVLAGLGYAVFGSSSMLGYGGRGRDSNALGWDATGGDSARAGRADERRRQWAESSPGQSIRV